MTVTLIDFHLTLKKPAVVKHGVKYIGTEINKGNAVDNIDFQGVKAGPLIGPGKTFTLRHVQEGGKVPYAATSRGMPSSACRARSPSSRAATDWRRPAEESPFRRPRSASRIDR